MEKHKELEYVILKVMNALNLLYLVNLGQWMDLLLCIILLEENNLKMQ